MDACCVCVLNLNMAGLSLSATKAKPLDRWQIWETGHERRTGPFWTGKTLLLVRGAHHRRGNPRTPNMITLLGTNISPKNGILKMIFLFPRWDMLVPWRVNSCKCFITSLNRLQLDYANATGASGDSTQIRPVLLVHWSLSLNRLTLNQHATTSFRLLGLNDVQEPVALRRAMILEVDSLDMRCWSFILTSIKPKFQRFEHHPIIHQTGALERDGWKKSGGKPGQQDVFHNMTCFGSWNSGCGGNPKGTTVGSNDKLW